MIWLLVDRHSPRESMALLSHPDVTRTQEAAVKQRAWVWSDASTALWLGEEIVRICKGPGMIYKPRSDGRQMQMERVFIA